MQFESQQCTAVLIIPALLYILHTSPYVWPSSIDLTWAPCLLQGTGSHLEQLPMEVLSLTHKLAEQQSKTTQAEAAATLLQISADLSQKVSHTSFA